MIKFLLVAFEKEGFVLTLHKDPLVSKRAKQDQDRRVLKWTLVSRLRLISRTVANAHLQRKPLMSNSFKVTNLLFKV